MIINYITFEPEKIQEKFNFFFLEFRMLELAAIIFVTKMFSKFKHSLLLSFHVRVTVG